MNDLESIKALRAELKQKAEAAKSDVTQRMEEIVKEIQTLVNEGKELADAAGITFSLANLDFLPYGAGGLRYHPGAADDDYEDGWRSSASNC